MARRIRIDRGFETRLDEFEQAIFILKILYEKYFNGFEKIEPSRDRDRVRRLLFDMQQDLPNNTAQQHRFLSLKARFNSYELYWQRNLVMIERGTHPKFKFRADVKERERLRNEEAAQARAEARAASDRKRKEDRAYHQLFDKFVEARRRCGQSTDLEYDKVRSALKKQVASIKEQTGARSVKFRISVEDGKAKVKAVPVR